MLKSLGFAVAAAVCLWALAGCAVRETRTEVSPVLLFPGDDGVVEFLTEEQRPIHLGDRRGIFEGVPLELLSDDPAGAYRWTFELRQPPDRGFLFMKLDNVAHLHAGCVLIVSINEGDVLRVFENPVARPGYRGSMTRSVAVDRALLRQGENTLTIIQHPCTSGQRTLRVRNDALLRAVELELRYTEPVTTEPSG